MKQACSNGVTRGGFTLLELLTAMAILAVMVTMLFEVFGQASRAWLQAENRVETFTTARAALDLMSRDLSQAIATSNISFLGSETNIAFVAPIANDSSGVDLEEVVYQLDGGHLVRRTTPFSAGSAWNFYSQPQDWPATINLSGVATVADNVVSVTFDYVGTNGVPVSSLVPIVPRAFWNSTPIPSWAGAIPPATAYPAVPWLSEVMTNRTPAGVQIAIDAIDSRAGARLQPGMTAAVSNNIIRPARKSFSTFVAIPNRQP